MLTLYTDPPVGTGPLIASTSAPPHCFLEILCIPSLVIHLLCHEFFFSKHEMDEQYEVFFLLGARIDRWAFLLRLLFSSHSERDQTECGGQGGD